MTNLSWVLENNGTRNRKRMLRRKYLTFCERQANMEKRTHIHSQKVLCKSRNLCDNFCKAKSLTHETVGTYALTGFSVPSFPNTRDLEKFRR